MLKRDGVTMHCSVHRHDGLVELRAVQSKFDEHTNQREARAHDRDHGADIHNRFDRCGCAERDIDGTVSLSTLVPTPLDDVGCALRHTTRLLAHK